MLTIDTCSLKTSLPLLIALLVVAQVDLASAFGWPQSLLSLLHLTAAHRTIFAAVFAPDWGPRSIFWSSSNSSASGPNAQCKPAAVRSTIEAASRGAA